MERLPKQELRQFSQEQYPEVRQRVAQEAKAKRREYFELQREIGAKVKQLKEEAEKQETDIAGLIQEIRIIDDEIAERKKSKIVELFNYSRIKKLSQEKENRILAKEGFEKEYGLIVNLLQELQREAGDKAQLREAREIVEKFYQGITEKWEEYKEEEKNRKIQQISANYNVFFLHSTTPYGVPDENSLLEPGTDWATKLRILLALEPTISASTFRQGDNRSNMWAHIGVLLKDGYVETADRRDVGTVAKNLNKRARSAGLSKAEKVSEQIESAITLRPSNVYNEIVVRSPKVAGVYLCLDNKEQDTIDVQGIKEIIEEFALPFYIIQNGSVFTTSWSPGVDKQFDKEYDPKYKKLTEEIKKCGVEKDGYIIVSPGKERKFKKLIKERENIQIEFSDKFFATGKKITPQDVLNNRFTVLEQKKREMIEGLLVEQPFKPTCEEAFFVENYYNGIETFIHLNALQRPEMFPGDAISYQRGQFESRSGRDINNEEVKLIFKVKMPSGYLVQYFISKNNELFQRSETKHHISGEKSSSLMQVDNRSWERLNGYLPGYPLHESARKHIRNSQDYLDAMRKTIQKLQEESLQEKEKNERLYLYSKAWLKRLAFHLYGFSEQAEKIGEQEIKAQAWTLANSIFPSEKYREVIKGRIDENGNFKVTLQDLKPKEEKAEIIESDLKTRGTSK